MLFSTKGGQVNDFFKRNNCLINNLITIRPLWLILSSAVNRTGGPQSG